MQESKELHQAIGFIVSHLEPHLKPVIQKLEQIIAHQERARREHESIDLKLQKKLRLAYLRQKYGEKDHYTNEEICSVHEHFKQVEGFADKCYEAGLVKRDGQYVDGTPAGINN
jgi:hypothetical protein